MTIYEELVPHLATVLAPITEGSVPDLKDFAAEILEDRVTVMAMPSGPDRDRLLSQLDDQLRTLAEAHRIKVEAHAWALFKNILNAFVGAVLAGMKKALLP